MRITVIIMSLLAIVSFADSSLSQNTSERIETGYVPPVPDGSVLFDQSYTGVIDDAIRAGGLFLRADEFILTEAGRVESIEWWGVFPSGQSGSFYLRIYSNDSNFQDVPGTPGDILWEMPAASVVNTDTGDDIFGFDIYHTEIILDPSDYFEADASTVYWFSIYYNESNYYLGVIEYIGNMCLSYSGGGWTSNDYTSFFRLNGTSYLALKANTWAAIKNGF